MKLEKIKSNTDLEDYFSKMTPEDSAVITTMCINRLARKVEELKDLYASLVKTYGFEMGICGITCIAQISGKPLETPILSMLGTDEGIQKGLNILKATASKYGFKLDNEEAQNAKEQG